MKTMKALSVVSVILVMAACSKEQPITTPEPQNNETAVKTITFGTVIDWDGSGISKASLSGSEGLDVHWTASDEIAVANNHDNTVQKAIITVDPSDATIGSFTINAVEGATVYYAYYPYSSTITFNHETETFAGPSLEHTTYQVDALTEKNALAMAGKSAVSGTDIVFKPCLAIVALTMDAKSTSNPPTGYTAVSGVRFAQSSTSIYSCPNSAGAYSVCLSSDKVVVTATGNTSWPNNVIDVQPSKSAALSSTSTYFFPIIPGGDVDGLIFQFFKVGSESADYELKNRKLKSVSVGDYLEIGPLDPVSAKKAKDEAAASAAITIDGVFTEWNSIDMYPSDNTKDAFPGDGTCIIEWKFTSDATNVYFYYKLSESAVKTNGQWESCLVTAFDTDLDETKGDSGSYNLGGGYEARTKAYAFKNAVNSDVELRDPSSPSSSSIIECPINGTSLGTIATGGMLDGAGNVFVETCIPRSKIGCIGTNKAVKVRHAFGWQAVSEAQTITLK